MQSKINALSTISCCFVVTWWCDHMAWQPTWHPMSRYLLIPNAELVFLVSAQVTKHGSSQSLEWRSATSYIKLFPSSFYCYTTPLPHSLTPHHVMHEQYQFERLLIRDWRWGSRISYYPSLLTVARFVTALGLSLIWSISKHRAQKPNLLKLCPRQIR